MRRIALALALAFVVSLTLLPGAAWAWRGHAHVLLGRPGFQSACCVFIGPGQPFGHRQFFNNRFIGPSFAPSVIVTNPIVVVEPQPMWVPGSWWWNGLQWVWWPGHWVFLGQ